MSTEQVMGCIDKAIGIVGKILLSIVLGAITLLILFFILLVGDVVISDHFFPERNGSYDLGDGIYMMGFDYDKSILIGTQIIGKTCYAGHHIIPDSLRDPVGVMDAKADSAWIIVKSIPRPETGRLRSTKEITARRFFLIDKQAYLESQKDSISNIEYIYVYDDSTTFINACKANSISLRFNE